MQRVQARGCNAQAFSRVSRSARLASLPIRSAPHASAPHASPAASLRPPPLTASLRSPPLAPAPTAPLRSSPPAPTASFRSPSPVAFLLSTNPLELSGDHRGGSMKNSRYVYVLLSTSDSSRGGFRNVQRCCHGSHSNPKTNKDPTNNDNCRCDEREAVHFMIRGSLRKLAVMFLAKFQSQLSPFYLIETDNVYYD